MISRIYHSILMSLLQMGNHAIMELVLHIMQCLYYYIIIIYYYLIITNGIIITHYYTFQTGELADACGSFCFASKQLLFAFLSCPSLLPGLFALWRP